MVIPAIPSASTSLTFDYHRTIVGYHGTSKSIAARLIEGEPFTQSMNDDDWLGHGIYFWEYGPQQAWWWAQRKHKEEAAVIGAMIQLGRCFDLLDPLNVELLMVAQENLVATLEASGKKFKQNAYKYKFMDCAVFNDFYLATRDKGLDIESVRAVFVPGKERAWLRSGVYRRAHVQVCVLRADNIKEVWSVRKDGRYGKE